MLDRPDSRRSTALQPGGVVRHCTRQLEKRNRKGSVVEKDRRPKARRDLSDSLAALQVFVFRMSLSRNRFPLSGDML
jgi:hypothetical protein